MKQLAYYVALAVLLINSAIPMMSGFPIVVCASTLAVAMPCCVGPCGGSQGPHQQLGVFGVEEMRNARMGCGMCRLVFAFMLQVELLMGSPRYTRLL